jgi:trehalose synthase
VLQEVALAQRALADYTHLCGRGLIEEIRELAEPVRGLRILHVSATAFGGGVSEILYTLVPLMRDVGLDAHWNVILGREEFFNVTKLLHNSLQGDENTLTEQQWEVFFAYNAMNARGLDADWDVVVVHDPQPLALRRGAQDRAGRWIWRCHLDMSNPNPTTVERVLPLIREFDASVWHMKKYVPRGVDSGVRIVPPAIDPLSPKNMALSPEDAAFVCEQFGIDPDRPLLCQVSRFDPWKDPIGVIDAYRMVTREVPDAQLALAGSMATDDPEGWEFFQRTFRYANGDPDIKILNNLNNVGAIEINAFQSQSDVVLQKSIREGFGLTVTEALWKARPTVAADVGGIPLQIADGESGFLVSSSEEAARRCIEVLADPELAKRLGRAGKERVRRSFLTPRLLRDWLEILGGREAAEAVRPAEAVEEAG